MLGKTIASALLCASLALAAPSANAQLGGGGVPVPIGVTPSLPTAGNAGFGTFGMSNFAVPFNSFNQSGFVSSPFPFRAGPVLPLNTFQNTQFGPQFAAGTLPPAFSVFAGTNGMSNFVVPPNSTGLVNGGLPFNLQPALPLVGLTNSQFATQPGFRLLASPAFPPLSNFTFSPTGGTISTRLAPGVTFTTPPPVGMF